MVIRQERGEDIVYFIFFLDSVIWIDNHKHATLLPRQENSRLDFRYLTRLKWRLSAKVRQRKSTLVVTINQKANLGRNIQGRRSTVGHLQHNKAFRIESDLLHSQVRQCQKLTRRAAHKDIYVILRTQRLTHRKQPEHEAKQWFHSWTNLTI